MVQLMKSQQTLNEVHKYLTYITEALHSVSLNSDISKQEKLCWLHMLMIY